MRLIHKRAAIGWMLLAVTLACPLAQSPGQAQSPRERQLAARDHVNQGNYLMGQNHFQEAIDEYKKALEIDPTNSVAKDNIITCHINWGNFYVRQRKYPEALKEYQTCLVLNPYNSKALNNINVVKATIAREAAAAKARGDNADNPFEPPSASGPPKAGSGAQVKKEQPSAIILTPGIKLGTGAHAGSSDAGQGEGAEQQASSPAGGSGDVEQAAGPAGAAGAAGAATPPPAAAPEAQVAPASHTAAPAAHPAAPALHPTAEGASPAQAGGSLEDLLAAVEVKIYGHKQSNMPVFKRLEKLEMDTAGQTRAGTIKERIEVLRKNYGL